MNRIAGILACLALSAAALMLTSRPRPISADDWLPIDPADLAMKDNPKQPGGEAMILYRDVKVDVSKANVDGDSEHEYDRIKIFTQDGTKRGHVEVEFDKKLDNVVHVEGRTIKPDGTIVKFDGQVLESTVEKNSGRKVLEKSFNLPDVTPGCIIEYRYSIQGQPNRVLNWGWIVSQPIYTREARFTYVPYSGYANNLRPIIRRNLLPADTTPVQQANGSYVMSAHDINGLVDEPMMPPYRPMQARVDFYYQPDDAPSATGPSDKYWNHYGEKWSSDLDRFVDKKKLLDAEVAKTVSPSDAPEIKLAKIYARVQHIRNLSVEDYRSMKERKDEDIKPNNNVEDVLNHGYGYDRQINFLFIGMARAAGFDATSVYISPRNYELFQPAANDVSQVSDDIVWVHAGSKDYYLDPSVPYYPFGLLPWWETSTSGIKVDKRGATIVTTSDSASSDATIVRNADLEIAPTGEITGTIQVDFTGERGALARDDERKEDETGRTTFFENWIKRWLPAGSEFHVAKISDWDDNTKPVHVEGKLTIPSMANTAAQRMLMPIQIFQMSQTSEFASEKRVNPVYIHFPYEEIDDVKFHLPPGYKMEGTPDPKKIDLGAVSFEIAAAGHGDTVEIKRHLVEKSVVFDKNQYPTLRRFFGFVKTDDNAQMVFQNAENAHN
jgi:Domain of Unknown Function with PDB structure (DUF3857)